MFTHSCLWFHVHAGISLFRGRALLADAKFQVNPFTKVKRFAKHVYQLELDGSFDVFAGAVDSRDREEINPDLLRRMP
jgi:hypothetical protein